MKSRSKKYTKVPDAPKLDPIKAIKNGELKTVQDYVESTSDALDQRHRIKKLALLEYAAEFLQKEIVEYLLEKGGNPAKASSSLKYTPIHYLIGRNKYKYKPFKSSNEKNKEAKATEILKILLAKIEDQSLLNRILEFSMKYGNLTFSSLIEKKLKTLEAATRSNDLMSNVPSTNVIYAKIGVSSGKEEEPLPNSSSSLNDRSFVEPESLQEKYAKALETIGRLTLEVAELKSINSALQKELKESKDQKNSQDNLFGPALVK